MIEAFAAAARRSREAGFRLLEVHAAHGYLLHEFLSPLSNERSDRYGGDFEGRIRLPLEVVAAVREAWPAELPLSVRISASDWVDGGWSLDDSIALAQRLGPLGVDLVDCSSGGNSPAQQIALGPGYQVPFSSAIRREAGIATAAVGLITEPLQAEEILRRGRRRRDPARPRIAARCILAPACRCRAGSRGRRLALAVPARAAAPDGACVLMALRLSVLDQSPIAEGGTGGQALRNSVDLAKLTDALGYSRYWVAEHHGMPMLASAAPEILIAEIAAVTERIRVGSGGVMLPHYSPFKVAETFSILGGLHGDRIDLGIGRAPGSDRETMFALQRDRRQMSPDDFPEQLTELLAYVENDFPDDHLFARLAALPGAPGKPDVWLLGSSPQSAIWAGQLGLPYSVADFINPSGAEIALLYRERFEPSRRRAEPELSVCVAAICADTDEEARRLAASTHMTITLLRRGQLIAVPPVEKALAFFEQPGESMAASGRRVVVGTPETVRAGLEAVAEEYGAGEVLVVTITYDHAARRRSYELIAEAFGLTP